MITFPNLSIEKKVEFLNYIIDRKLNQCSATMDLKISCYDCPFNNNKYCGNEKLIKNRIIQAKKLLATFSRKIKEI